MVIVFVSEEDAVDRFRRDLPGLEPSFDLPRRESGIDQEACPARLDDTTVAARARGEDADSHGRTL